MKLSKKIISVILSLTMIMSAISVCFVTLAAGPASATEADWTALMNALKNDYVKSAPVTYGNNTVTITDNADGDVLTAMRAYVTVFDKVANITTTANANNSNNAYRTSSMVANTIATELQNRDGEAFTAYNMGSVLTAFRANVTAYANVETSQNKVPNGLTFTVNVKAVPSTAILGAATIDDINAATSNDVFTFKHNRVNYRGSGWFASTYYYLNLSAKVATSKANADAYDVTALKTLETAVADNSALMGKSLAEMLEMTAEDLGAAYQALAPAYEEAMKVFSTAIVSHFFNKAELEATITNIDDASNIIAFKPICEKINTLLNVDYSDYTTAQLVALYTELAGYVEEFDEASDAVKANLKNAGLIDDAEVKTALADIKSAKEVAELTDLKASCDNAMNEFNAFTEDMVIDDTVSLEALEAAIGTLKGFKGAIATFEAANIATVLGDSYVADIDATVSALEALVGIENIDAIAGAKYAEFVEKVYGAFDVSADVATIQEKYEAMIQWRADYDTFKADYTAAYGEELASKILAKFNDDIDAKVEAGRENILAAASVHIVTAYELFNALTTEVGLEDATVTNVSSYAKINYALKSINEDLYQYAITLGLSEEVQAMHDSLNTFGTLDDYFAFKKTNGFDRFESSSITDIIRYVSDKDVARNKDYTVSDENVEAIIALLDKALQSTEIKGLGVDLGELLGKLPEMIYTDDIVNTIVGMLFPMVTNLLIPVWATLLPPTFDIPSGDPAIPDIVQGKSGTLDILPIGTVAKNIKLNIFPELLAGDVAADFPEVAAVLRQANTEPEYIAKKVSDGLAPGEVADDNNVYALDADGNHINEKIINPWDDAVLYNEDGELALEWGITGKDSFITAISDILRSLESLLVGILGGGKSGYFRGYTVGKGAILDIINIPVLAPHVKLNLNTLQLVVKIGDWDNDKGADLFNNVLAPIFETLGLEKDEIADGNTFAKNEDILYGIFNALELVLDKLAASPVTFLAEALPNIAYAVDSGALMNLVESIDIPFVVKAGVPSTKEVANSATLEGGLASLASGIIESLAGGALEEAIGLDMFIEDFPTSLNISELVDLNAIEINGSKLDLNSLNGVLGLVGGLLGFDLPAINGATLATLGTLTEKDTRRDAKAYEWGTDGKAAYIEANKADVLVFVLKYALNALQDPAFLNGIMSAVGGEEAVELPAIVEEIIANIAANSDDAIAAIAELIFPQDYDMPTITWRQPIDSVTYETLTDDEKNEYIVANELVKYSDIWTKDKAEYVAEHLPHFIDNVLMLLGVTGVTEESLGGSLTDIVTGLINGLYKADTVNSLVEMINGLVSGLELPEELLAIITDTTGLELDAWAEMSFNFENGDKAAFKAAIVEVLNPLTKVLKFILADEDLVIRLTDAETGKFDVVTANGYDGYSFGLVPVLEALDADVMTTEAFLADSDNLVKNLVDMLVSAIDKIAENPVDQIIAVLPNVLYFLASDGLTVAVDNLLFPVNVVLDTIRPIYDVNLIDLIGFDIRFAETDPVSFLFSEISSLLAGATGLDFNINFNTPELFALLSFEDREAYTSANGSEAYKITMSTESTADMITVIGRYILGQFVFSENATEYAKLAYEKFDLTDEQFAMLFTVLSAMKYLNEEGPDYTMGILFWIFFGADTAVDATLDAFDVAEFNIEAILAQLESIKTEASDKAAYVIATIYKTVFEALWTSSEKVESILAEVQKRIDDSVAKFDEEIKKIPAQVDDVLAKILAKVEKNVNDAKDKINDTMDDIKDKVDETLDDIKDKVQEGVDDAKDKVEEGLGDAQDKVDETLGDITDKVQGGVDDVNDKLNGVADNLNNVNNQMNGIFAKIIAFFQDLMAKIKALFGIK